MRKMEKPSPTESPLFPLLFEFDPKPAEEILTAWGGIPLVVQAFRSLGLPGSVKQHLAVKERQRGYDEATFVENFVVLNAVGGECLDDFERLRADPGLGELLGHEVLVQLDQQVRGLVDGEAAAAAVYKLLDVLVGKVKVAAQ